MANFWAAHQTSFLSQIKQKQEEEVANAKKAAQEATLKKPPPPKEDSPSPPAADDADDTPPRARSRSAYRPKKVSLERMKSDPRPTTTRRKHRLSSSDSDVDMGEDEIVGLGKKLVNIRDLDKAYPLLNTRARSAVTMGVRKMINGGFRDHLTQEEKKSIAERKRDYEKICKSKKKRNPFEGKRKHVGDTYRKFMTEVKLVSESSSSSDEGGGNIDWTKFE